MRHHFGRVGWPSSKLGVAPSTPAQRDLLIDALQVLRNTRNSPEIKRKQVKTSEIKCVRQDRKTEIYRNYVAPGPQVDSNGMGFREGKSLPRPGILELIDHSLERADLKHLVPSGESHGISS